MNERLIWEAYACLKDLGVSMSYDEFLPFLEDLTNREDSKEPQGVKNENVES